MKLRDRILLSNLTVLVLAILIFTLISSQMFQSYFKDETQHTLLREQQMVTQSLDTLLDNAQNCIRLVSTDDGLQDSILQLKESVGTEAYPVQKVMTSSTMVRILSSYLYPVTNFLGGAIVVDGEVIYSGYNIPQDSASRCITPEFLEQIRTAQKPTWSGLTQLETNDGTQNVLMLGKSILHTQKGIQLGECIFFIAEDVFSNTFSSAKNINSNLYLTDPDYKVLSCANKDFLGKSLLDVLNVQLSPTANTASPIQFTGINDEKNIYSVSTYDRMDWRLVNTISYENAAQKSSHTLYMIFALGLGCVLLLVLFSSLIATTMVNPIRQIATSMEKAGKGNLSIRESETYGGEMQIIASSFNKLMDKVQALMEQTRLEQKQRRENEFRILQAQINPHFLYNTIETIISFITLDMKKEATTAAMSLASFYKRSLSSGKTMIPISEELQLTQSYISIQKLRYGDYFDYDIQVEDIGQYYIPKLTLQPLIENAIYHGIKEKDSPGQITVTGYEQDELVILEVFDTGLGIEPERISQLLTEDAPHKTGSFGLANVDQRIKYKFGPEYGLSIESEVGRFTRITITLPKDNGGIR